mmetsp:Transcript_17572/g.38690  ORF Transcript_17572/g.38690 Transcript_17572/m.38690 type:complete len:370 (-) Transcript_17572:200-1309(-)
MHRRHRKNRIRKNCVPQHPGLCSGRDLAASTQLPYNTQSHRSVNTTPGQQKRPEKLRGCTKWHAEQETRLTKRNDAPGLLEMHPESTSSLPSKHGCHGDRVVDIWIIGQIQTLLSLRQSVQRTLQSALQSLCLHESSCLLLGLCRLPRGRARNGRALPRLRRLLPVVYGQAGILLQLSHLREGRGNAAVLGLTEPQHLNNVPLRFVWVRSHNSQERITMHVILTILLQAHQPVLDHFSILRSYLALQLAVMQLQLQFLPKLLGVVAVGGSVLVLSVRWHGRPMQAVKSSLQLHFFALGHHKTVVQQHFSIPNLLSIMFPTVFGERIFLCSTNILFPSSSAGRFRLHRATRMSLFTLGVCRPWLLHDLQE